MANSLKELSQEMIAAVESEMRQVLVADEKAGDPFYGMVHYHMGWVDESLAPAQNKSGKRIRPLLCLLVCRAAGGDWQQAVPAAAAIEILHNFTLVHDDIQDDSPTRRGRPTVWNIWGVPQAINTGDAMFAQAHLAMCRLSDRDVAAPIVVRALQRLDETCIELTRGQYADMHFETRDDVTVAEYLAMIDGKTAALLALSAELGALVAGQDQDSVAHYATFGRDLGLAFQVRDDILGIWGDESKIGKSAATDIEARKKSLPVLFGLEKEAELRHLYSQPANGSSFVEQVINLLDEVGARQFAEKHESGYSESALQHLQDAAPRPEAAGALNELTAMLLNRQT